MAAARVTDTIKEAGEDGVVVRTHDRRRLWAIQTPQAFRTRRCCAGRWTRARTCSPRPPTTPGWWSAPAAASSSSTSPPANFKVTTPHDLRVAELLLATSRPPGILRRVLTDYHVHLRPDEEDARPERYFTRANAERYREAAEERGIAELGVAEHIHRFTQSLDIWQHPWWRRWARDDVDDYCAFVRGETDLRLGIEADFVAGRESRIAAFLEAREWDFVVGSVHFVRDAAVDLEGPEWEHVWGRGDSADRVWQRYFETLAEAAALRPLRHHGPPRPRQGVGQRPAAARSATRGATTSPPSQAMLDAGVAMEVSTAGLRKPAGELYPGPALLEMAVDAGLPLALSSDAHVPEQLGFRYEDAIAALRAAGVQEICVFERRAAGWSRSGERPHRHRRRHARLRGRAPAHPRRRRHPARAGAGRPLRRRRPHPRDHRRAARRRRARRHRPALPGHRPGYEGADSIALLRAIAGLLERHGFAIEHVDSTVMLERPKLAPHRDAMRERARPGAWRRAGARERQGDDRRGHGLRRPRARASRRWPSRRCPLRPVANGRVAKSRTAPRRPASSDATLAPHRAPLLPR